jgi:pimeloyl-ACP methyl ester carboxylesterase
MSSSTSRPDERVSGSGSGSGLAAPPEAFVRLVGRFDPDVLRVGGRPARLRLQAGAGVPWDVHLSRDGAVLRPAGRRVPETGLLAAPEVWSALADDAREAYRRFFDGSLRSRGSAHLALGFLAATSGDRRPGRLTWSSVRTPGGRVSLLEGGTGRPLVCIHGLGGTKISMLPIVSALADRRRVIALDLPGFGESEMPRDDISISGYGRTVESLIDKLDLGQVVVVGHSMGGFTAAEFAIQYPPRVERLVLQAAAGISSNNTERAPMLAGARVVGAVMARAAAQSRLFASRPRLRHIALATVVRHPSRIPADMAWELISHSGREGFLPALKAILSYDFRERLSQISAPTLVITGSDDMLVPADDADEYVRVIPDARKVFFDDTGHTPMIERPETFNDCVVKFLGREADERPSEAQLERVGAAEANGRGDESRSAPAAS